MTAAAKRKPAARPRKTAVKQSAAAKAAKPHAARKSNSDKGLSAAAFRRIALSFPGAEEKPSYGKPAIFILKKFFTRLRAEDNSLVLAVSSIDERDMLIEAEPALFHITDHYRDYPMVLARLERLDAATLKAMLARRWRELYPKKLLKALEG